MWRRRWGIFIPCQFPIISNIGNLRRRLLILPPPTIAELGKITDRTFLISLGEIKNCRFINSQSEFIKMYDGIKLFSK